jgi:hypothetical protein
MDNKMEAIDMIDLIVKNERRQRLETSACANRPCVWT